MQNKHSGSCVVGGGEEKGVYSSGTSGEYREVSSLTIVESLQREMLFINMTKHFSFKKRFESQYSGCSLVQFYILIVPAVIYSFVIKGLCSQIFYFLIPVLCSLQL